MNNEIYVHVHVVYLELEHGLFDSATLRRNHAGRQELDQITSVVIFNLQLY